MRRVVRWLVAGAVVLVAGAPGAAAEPPPVDEVLDEARRSGKPVLIEFSAEWCGPCKYFAEKILPAPEVAEALRAFRFVSYDIDAERGGAAARRFGVSSVPTFLAIDGSGEVRSRQTGLRERTVASFTAFLEEAALVTASLEEVAKRLKDDAESPVTLLWAARWHRSRDRVDEALDYYARAEKRWRWGPGAALAAWEALELRRADERVSAVVQDASDYVRRYAAGYGASTALQRALLSGRLSPEEASRLFAHCRRAMPVHEQDRAPELIFVAVAGGLLDDALDLAAHYVRMGVDRFRANYVLATVHLVRGEHDEVDALLPELERHAGSDDQREEIADLRRRLRRDDRTSPEAEHYRQHAKAYFDALRDPDSVPAHRDGSGASSPRFRAFLRFHEAADDVLREAGRQCADVANGLSEVWVRLFLAGDDEPPRRVIVIEPDASPSLRNCLRTALREHALPAAPRAIGRRYTVAVPIEGSSVRPATPATRDPGTARAYMFGRGAVGLGPSIGIGGLAELHGGRLADWVGSFMVEGHVAAADGTDPIYAARALAGLGFERDRIQVSLLSGLGVSRPGPEVERGVEIPGRIAVSVAHRRFTGLVWIGGGWILDAASRRGGSSSFLGADEMQAGLGVSLPAPGIAGLFAGATYGQAGSGAELALLFGVRLY